MKFDILILGSGPAGMASAIYSSRSGYTSAIIDPMGPGGQLLYIDEIENYPGVEKCSGLSLSERMEKQCESFGVSFLYQKALSIEKKNNLFYVKTDEDTIEAKALIVALGASHRKLNVKGENEYSGKGVSYCATCDGPFFKGKKVIVVGGGDTALSEAYYLSKIAKEVVLIHRRDTFRAQKILVDRVKERENIQLIINETISEIKGEGKEVKSVILSSGREEDVDGVFIFVGITPSSSILENLCLLKDGFVVVNEKKETSLPGLFAAGDITTTPFRQVVTAVSDGAIASHSADEYISSLHL